MLLWLYSTLWRTTNTNNNVKYRSWTFAVLRLSKWLFGWAVKQGAMILHRFCAYSADERNRLWRNVDFWGLIDTALLPHRPRGFLSLQPRTPLFPSLSPHRPGLAPSTADAGMASTCTGTLMKAASWIWPCTNLVTEPFGHPCFTWGLARVPLSYLILKIKLDIKPYVCLGINHTHIKTN
jgi:hypothetical protein